MPDLITTDIDNFWRAFDAADRLPTTDRIGLFKAAYFDVASKGMRDFIDLRLGIVEDFEQHVTRYDAYYRSTRSSTMRIREFEGEIRHFYKRFLKLYPSLHIPTTTFVIGRLSCRGTTSPSGLLVGAEMFGKINRSPIETLRPWQRALVRPVSEIPSIVIHELVHIQQKVLERSEDSLLAKSVREGVAVIMTELVTRRRDETTPYDYGRLHEEELWLAFKEVMDETDASDWLENGNTVVERPADLGCFIGRQICEAYLEKQGGGEGAVRKLIEAEDYEETYRESGYGSDK